MSEQPVIHSTFVIERNYPKPPERVFAAFAEMEKKRRWFAEGPGHDVEKFEMDFQVGGREWALYRFKEGTPFPGVELTNEAEYHDIVPNQRVVMAMRMTLGGRRISSALVTVELIPTETGTTLVCTHQGAFFEGSGGAEMREQGWRFLFGQLASELASS